MTAAEAFAVIEQVCGTHAQYTLGGAESVQEALLILRESLCLQQDAEQTPTARAYSAFGDSVLALPAPLGYRRVP